MKIYTKPQITVLTVAKEDVLSVSIEIENTFWGVADGGMGYGVDVDFDLLRRSK